MRTWFARRMEGSFFKAHGMTDTGHYTGKRSLFHGLAKMTQMIGWLSELIQLFVLIDATHYKEILFNL